MKRILPLLALLSAPAFAQDAVPAATPEEVAAPAPAPAARRAPAPGRVMLPSGPKWDALPPEEREHIRRMAEFKAARDAAEVDLLRLDDEAQARKEAILAENEEAKALHERMLELMAEFDATTNALETIYRADETLQGIEAQIAPARQIVDANQDSLTKEIVAAMRQRMAKQRAAFEAENPPAPIPEETPESLGMTPEAYSNLLNRPKAGFVPPARPKPDFFPGRPAPAPQPAL